MDVIADQLTSTEETTQIAALKTFIETTKTTFSFPELDKNERREKVWASVYNLARTTIDKFVLCDCFTVFKILSRDKTRLNELAGEDLLGFVQKKAGLSEENIDLAKDEIVVVEALKFLCNVVFNSPVALTICCKNGVVEGLMKRLKVFKDPKLPEDVRFFDMKLLFLITALYPEILQKLKNEMHAVSSLTETLKLILSEAKGKSGHNRETEHGILTDKQVDTLCEILKSLFNLTRSKDTDTNLDEEEELHMTNLAPILRKLLVFPKKTKDKEIELVNHTINLLYNLPTKCYPTLITPIKPTKSTPIELQFMGKDMSAVAKILNFLETKFSENVEHTPQQAPLSPVLCVLLNCAKSSREMRKYLRSKILPPLKDIHTRPEEGHKLRNCLCALMTTPTSQLNELSAELIFVLCKHNVARMIKYTGYGNAAGLFANRGLLGGRRSEEEALYQSDSEDSDTEEYLQHKHGINPVTGVYEPPKPSPMANMSEEQKEYEAMKLVNLMEDMLKKGVVKPCRVGEDGRPEPVEHVLQLQEGLKGQQVTIDTDSD